MIQSECLYELFRVRHEPIRLTAIIVSSMGPVSGPSLKALYKVLRCGDRAMQKLGNKMSETVTLGSLSLGRAHTQEVAAARPEVEEDASAEEANAMPDEDVSRLPIAEVEAELRTSEEVNDDDSEYESNDEQEPEMGGEGELSEGAAGMDALEERRVIEEEPFRNMATIEIGRYEPEEEENRRPYMGREEAKEEPGSGMSDEPADDENATEDWA
jgi:hypothetical protein